MNTLIILGMAVITFTNRYAFFIQKFHFEPNEKMRRLLSFSSYSNLTAIWAPIVLNFDPSQGFTHSGYDYLVATGLAIVLAMLKIPSILIVMITSAVFFSLRFLFFL